GGSPLPSPGCKAAGGRVTVSEASRGRRGETRPRLDRTRETAGMKFTKMHGLGNDYVYVNTFDQREPADPARLAVAVSDRHFGVGADGLILIGPSRRADARMRMFNADGSESEMCGNGVRCVAKYIYDHDIARKSRVTVETGRGVLALDLEVA